MLNERGFILVIPFEWLVQTEGFQYSLNYIGFFEAYTYVRVKNKSNTDRSATILLFMSIFDCGTSCHALSNILAILLPYVFVECRQ